MTRCSRGVFALLAIAPLAGLHAQQPGITALPDTVVTRIDRVFGGIGRDAPGCALGLARNGQPVLLRAYGLANLEYGVPNTHQTIFESGSVAKQFTAAAMVLLAQDGKLSLDDDIRKHLPEVPDFGKKITIRNLLTHTSGLRDQWGLLSIKGLGPGTQVHTLNTIVDLVAHQKALNFDPGSEYLYSNTGYALAAVIIQRVSGMPFATFSQERLFKPLGMTSTQWRDDFARVVKNRATAYDGSTSAGFRQDMPFTNVHGNGGLLTTVGDLLKWNAFLDAPGTIGGAAALVQTLTTPMTLTNGKRITYALGLSVTTRDGMREISHSGSTAGYQTWLARYPDERASVAVLCNAGGAANATAFGTFAINTMLGRQPPRVVASTASTTTLSAAELERYAGTFRGSNPELLARMIVRDGQLVSVMPSNRTLTAAGVDRFRIGPMELAYQVTNGKVQRVLQIVGTDTTVFSPIAAWTPSPKDLRAFVGNYWSDELDMRLSFEMRDSVLVVKRRPADEVVLRPTVADAFTAPGVGAVAFERNRAGRVTGFGIWAGRVRNVRFTKEK